MQYIGCLLQVITSGQCMAASVRFCVSDRLRGGEPDSVGPLEPGLPSWTTGSTYCAFGCGALQRVIIRLHAGRIQSGWEEAPVDIASKKLQRRLFHEAIRQIWKRCSCSRVCEKWLDACANITAHIETPRSPSNEATLDRVSFGRTMEHGAVTPARLSCCNNFDPFLLSEPTENRAVAIESSLEKGWFDIAAICWKEFYPSTITGRRFPVLSAVRLSVMRSFNPIIGPSK